MCICSPKITLMKKLFYAMNIIALTTTVNAQYNTTNLKADYSSESAYTYGNLRLYPVRANDIFFALHKNIGEYAVLADAVENKKIVITEVSGSGTVNTLFAENLSTDSIYVMAGEIVKGGKQDRIIAQDFILAPGDKVDVGAFCVEHGRWSAAVGSVDTTFIMDEVVIQNYNVGSVAIAAPQFEKTAKAVSADVREAAIVKKNQSEVWDEVATVTVKNNAASGTGSYNQIENSSTYQDSLKKYLDHFSPMFKDDNRIIGLVAVTGDNIIATDLFATNNLFVNQYENLLHSYISSAITGGSTVTINATAVQDYLSEFLSDEKLQKAVIENDGSQFKYNGKVLHFVRF